MFGRLAKRNDVKTGLTFGIGQVDYVPVENPDQIDALLTIGGSIIVLGDDRAIKHALAPGEIKIMLFEIAAAFRVVPRHHMLYTMS